MTQDTNDESINAAHDNATPASTVDKALLDVLVCPLTRGPLEYDRANSELISRQAGKAFPIRDGVPIMLIDEARSIDISE